MYLKEHMNSKKLLLLICLFFSSRTYSIQINQLIAASIGTSCVGLALAYHLKSKQLIESSLEKQTTFGFLNVDLSNTTAWEYFLPLKKLFTDISVQAIILNFTGSHCSCENFNGYASADTLLHMIIELKKCYKKAVYAYSEPNLLGQHYLLACAADSIFISQASIVGNMGVHLVISKHHEKDKQEGIDHHFISSGLHKSIFWKEVALTDEQKYEAQILINNLHNKIIENTKQNRNYSAAQADLLKTGQAFTYRQATEMHFVDNVGCKSDLFASIGKQLNVRNKPHNFNGGAVSAEPFPTYSVINSLNKKACRIGMIRITQLSSPSWKYNKALLNLFTDNSLQAIIIAVDSKGSQLNRAGAIFEDILSLKKIYPKPIITYIEHTAQSGAYKVASATDYILASSYAIIGLIGTATHISDSSKKNEKEYLLVTDLTSGKSGLFCEKAPWSEERRTELQQKCDFFYDEWINELKSLRPQLASHENSWKEAQIMLADEALRIGLIDQIGSPFDAFKYVKKQLGLSIDQTKSVFDDMELVIINPEYEPKPKE